MSERLIQFLNLCLEKNIPFVSFRLLNDSNIKTWVQVSGAFNFVERIDEVIDKTGFVYAPFHRRTNFPITFFEPELIIENDNIDENLIREISEKPPMYPEYPVEIPFEVGKKDYLVQANTFIRSFDDTFNKAVLSRTLHYPKSKKFNPGKFFIQLQNKYPGAFCHMINIPGAGTWAGASPETLLRMDEKHVHTVSLAGTQIQPQKGKFVNWSEKDIEEQNIVTNYIESVLEKFEVSNFQKDLTRDQIAGGVIHRATRFNFDRSLLKNKLAEFILELHPTPAVCGMPKKTALDLILKTEKHNREYYSGYCGVLDPIGNTDLFVNLRCMKILPDKLSLFVGGGLTAQSVAEKEWEETSWKAKTLLDLMKE